MSPVLLAASGHMPEIPSDWPGWLVIIAFGLLVAAGIRKWMKS